MENKVTITEIRLPDWKCVRESTVGQELLVYFTVNGKKYKCQYIQEHYFYRGMPGTHREACHFYRIEEGEQRCIADCSGEFKIPHKPGVVEAYANNTYNGDDERYLYADEAIVLEYLINPFVQRYF